MNAIAAAKDHGSPTRKVRPITEKPSFDAAALHHAADLLDSCRTGALKIGMLAVLRASAPDEESRAAFDEEFLRVRAAFIAAIDEKVERAPFLEDFGEIAAQRLQIHAFHDRLARMSSDKVELRLVEATELAAIARLEFLPAIDVVVAHVGTLGAEIEAQTHERTAEKAALVDGMLTEMSRVGRMIGLISINASVEAARAGGNSGRAFQVIAEEVRDLARQSSSLLDQTKARLSDDGHSRKR